VTAPGLCPHLERYAAAHELIADEPEIRPSRPGGDNVEEQASIPRALSR
jgi:hypothetical protein